MWLKGGQIYDVDSGSFATGDIRLESGAIAEIGRAPSDAQAVDLDGAYLLPGFIDCHVHICVNTESADGNNPWRDALPATIALWAARAARRMVRCGITTARDVGGWDYHEIAVREAIETGWIEGPRLLCAGKILSITSSTRPYYLGMYEEADGPDAVRHAARKQLANGANLIKVLASGAVNSTKYERADAIQYRPDELRAAVEIAEDNFTHVAAHAHATEAIKNAILAGCRSVEHGTYGSDETFRLMVEHGTYMVPTICTAHAFLQDPAFAAKALPHVRERYEYLQTIRYANLNKARETGVKVAMGTDVGTPGNHCGDNMQEVALMVERCGFSPADAIRSATVIAAELLALDGEIGRLRPGLAGDVIAVDRSPLDDINALRDVFFVAARGQIVRNDRVGR
ncbi:MAG: amidohydrolase family protein [Pseudomonadota bacterium]